MLGRSQDWWRPGKQLQAPSEPENLVSLGTVSDQKERTQTSLSCSWFTPVKTQSSERKKKKKNLPSLPWASTWLEEARALPWTCPDHLHWVKGHSKRGRGYFTRRRQRMPAAPAPRGLLKVGIGNSRVTLPGCPQKSEYSRHSPSPASLQLFHLQKMVSSPDIRGLPCRMFLYSLATSAALISYFIMTNWSTPSSQYWLLMSPWTVSALLVKSPRPAWEAFHDKFPNLLWKRQQSQRLRGRFVRWGKWQLSLLRRGEGHASLLEITAPGCVSGLDSSGGGWDSRFFTLWGCLPWLPGLTECFCSVPSRIFQRHTGCFVKTSKNLKWS